MKKTNKYYIVVPMMGAYHFVENITNEPVECLKRLKSVQQNIPGALLCTPMSYRAIWSQLTVVDNDMYSGNVLFTRCKAFVGDNRENSIERALGLFRMLRRKMSKMIARGESHQSALQSITLSLGTD